MRYHWGLAPGHVYSGMYSKSQDGESIATLPPSDFEDVDVGNDDTGNDGSPIVSGGACIDIGNNVEESDSRDDDSSEDSEGLDDDLDEELHDEAELLAMDEMYGDSQDMDLYE
jgi:hypothetical protein